MSTISLKVEAFAGTTIEDACRDLCALADRVGILCEVGFNGVKLWAYPGDHPAELAKAWDEQMKRPASFYRIAMTRPRGVNATPAPSATAYTKQCRFYDVTVRGRRCEATDHPDGRRTYFEWHEGSDKLREVPARETILRAEIDAAITAAYGVTVRVPWGTWELGGAWRHNPALKMSAAEQRAANEAAGYVCPGTDGVDKSRGGQQ